LECIAITQKRINPDQWTPFTWEEYCDQCDHSPIEAEKAILDAMVHGRTVSLNDMGKSKSVFIDAGYLTIEDERYVVSPKLLKAMEPFATFE